MPKKKLQDTLSQTINEVVVAGAMTMKGHLGKDEEGNETIKFVLDEQIYCIAKKEYAELVNILVPESLLLVVGKVVLINQTNVVLAKEVELYTPQPRLDLNKVKKELKLEKRKF